MPVPPMLDGVNTLGYTPDLIGDLPVKRAALYTMHYVKWGKRG